MFRVNIVVCLLEMIGFKMHNQDRKSAYKAKKKALSFEGSALISVSDHMA
jgi:hypothetical protein